MKPVFLFTLHWFYQSLMFATEIPVVRSRQYRMTIQDYRLFENEGSLQLLSQLKHKKKDQHALSHLSCTMGILWHFSELKKKKISDWKFVLICFSFSTSCEFSNSEWWIQAHLYVFRWWHQIHKRPLNMELVFFCVCASFRNPTSHFNEVWWMLYIYHLMSTWRWRSISQAASMYRVWC